MNGKRSVNLSPESVAVGAAFLKNTKGSTAIEYGLIASLIAVAIVGVIATIGGDIFTLLRSIDLT